MQRYLKTIVPFLVVLFILNSCSNSNIDAVKGGTLGFDRSITVGSALDSYEYFESTEWKEFTDKKGREIVEFNGVFDLDKFEGKSNRSVSKIKQENINKLLDNDILIVYQLQFVMHKTGDAFQVAYNSVNIKKDNKIETFEDPYKINSNYGFIKQIYDNKTLPVIMNVLSHKYDDYNNKLKPFYE